jgi:hypothetical protein
MRVMDGLMSIPPILLAVRDFGRTYDGFGSKCEELALKCGRDGHY